MIFSRSLLGRGVSEEEDWYNIVDDAFVWGGSVTAPEARGGVILLMVRWCLT